jgi:hypothetical protein
MSLMCRRRNLSLRKHANREFTCSGTDGISPLILQVRCDRPMLPSLPGILGTRLETCFQYIRGT